MARLPDDLLNPLILRLKDYPEHGRAAPGYPRARKRIAPSTKGGFVVQQAPAAAGADRSSGGVDGITRLGGASLEFFLFLAIGETEVHASFFLPHAFRLARVASLSNKLIGDNGFYRVLIASDDSTLGGLATTGVPINSETQQNPNLNHGNVLREFFPNLIVSTSRQVIKVIGVNDSAFAQILYVDVDVVYMT